MQEFFFIKNDDYFRREFLYTTSGGDYPDNLERFSFFSKQIYSILKRIDFTPSIFQKVLYPDQIVYLYNNISFSGDEQSKINIDLKKGEIIYRTNERESRTIEETLVAYFYVMQMVNNSDLKLVCLKTP